MGSDDSHLFLPGFKLLGYQTREQAVKAALALQEPFACALRSTLGALELQDETSINLADLQQPRREFRRGVSCPLPLSQGGSER